MYSMLLAPNILSLQNMCSPDVLYNNGRINLLIYASYQHITEVCVDANYVHDIRDVKCFSTNDIELASMSFEIVKLIDIGLYFIYDFFLILINIIRLPLHCLTFLRI